MDDMNEITLNLTHSEAWALSTTVSKIVRAMDTCEHCPEPHGAATVHLDDGSTAHIIPAGDFDTYVAAVELANSIRLAFDKGDSAAQITRILEQTFVAEDREEDLGLPAHLIPRGWGSIPEGEA